jgi:hypothetical protein
MIPVDGAVGTPLAEQDGSNRVEEAFGGIWQCPPGDPAATVGTGFVVGLDAANLATAVQVLSKKALTDHDKAKNVKSRKLVVAKGRAPVTVFVYRQPIDPVLVCGGTCPAGTPTEVAMAAAEPRRHFYVASAVLPGSDPLPFLKAQLKAGLIKAKSK